MVNQPGKGKQETDSVTLPPPLALELHPVISAALCDLKLILKERHDHVHSTDFGVRKP